MELVFAIERGVITNSPDLKTKQKIQQAKKQTNKDNNNNMSKPLVTNISILCTLLYYGQLSCCPKETRVHSKNELDLKSLLASKHLRTLVSSNTLPFYCLYLIGFTFKYIKVYFVQVVWFWTDPGFVSTVKLVFYLPDKKPRWRALWLCCRVVKSSQFHVTNKKERKKLCEMCVHCVHCCCFTGCGFNHTISFDGHI